MLRIQTNQKFIPLDLYWNNSNGKVAACIRTCNPHIGWCCRCLRRVRMTGGCLGVCACVCVCARLCVHKRLEFRLPQTNVVFVTYEMCHARTIHIRINLTARFVKRVQSEHRVYFFYSNRKQSILYNHMRSTSGRKSFEPFKYELIVEVHVPA